MQANTSSSGRTCGSKYQRLNEWMSRDLTASGRASGTLCRRKKTNKRLEREWTPNKKNIRVQAVIVNGVHSLRIHIAQQLRIDGPEKKGKGKTTTTHQGPRTELIAKQDKRNWRGKGSPPIHPWPWPNPMVARCRPPTSALRRRQFLGTLRQLAAEGKL